MKQEADEFARELDVLRRLVPTENEVPALLESISTAARRAGLELSDVQPDGVVNGDQFDTYRYKLGVTGPYHQVAEFLANIGSLSRIVAPINVDLTPSNRASPDRRPKKNEQFLDVHFGIQTYVAHAEPRRRRLARQACHDTLLVPPRRVRDRRRLRAGVERAEMPGTAAKAAAHKAADATNAHIEAEQRPDGPSRPTAVVSTVSNGDVRRDTVKSQRQEAGAGRRHQVRHRRPCRRRSCARNTRTRTTAAAIRSTRCSPRTSCARR